MTSDLGTVKIPNNILPLSILSLGKIIRITDDFI